jgi:hypothetical protein
MFVVVPLVASFSPTRYLPGFQDILDIETRDSQRYLIAGVAFILADAIEFVVILRCFILSQSRSLQPKLRFFQSVTGNWRMRA